jgi:hypothetical protein
MICLPGAVCAEQVYIETHTNKDGSYNELWHSTDHDIYYIKHYDKDGNLKSIYVGVNPSPDDNGGTGGDPKETAKALADMLKKQGGNIEYEENFWSTPLGRALIESGKGPQPGDPIDPPPEGEIWHDADGAGGSGGIDPSGGSVVDQIKKNKGKNGDDDDDDDGDSGNTGLWPEEYAANPELVNPSPIYKPGSGSGKVKPMSANQPSSPKFGKKSTTASLKPQKRGQKLELKGGKLAGNPKLTAGKSAEAIFRVMNTGDASSKAMPYSVKCKGLGKASGKCAASKKRGSLTGISAKKSKDIKIKLTPMAAGEYLVMFKLANGEAQTLKFKVAPSKLKMKRGILKRTPKMQLKPRVKKPSALRTGQKG